MYYVKPSRWWRRARTFQLTVWPSWLAQALCPHTQKNPIMWFPEKKTITYHCVDCHKHIEVVNDCLHGEVEIASSMVIGGKEIPSGYRCLHCGQPLSLLEVNSSTKVNPNATH